MNFQRRLQENVAIAKRKQQTVGAKSFTGMYTRYAPNVCAVIGKNTREGKATAGNRDVSNKTRDLPELIRFIISKNKEDRIALGSTEPEKLIQMTEHFARKEVLKETAL